MFGQLNLQDVDLFDAQQALSFLRQQAAEIEAEVYETPYADTQYQNLVPVDTGADEWAKSVTYYSTDKVGRAEWFHHKAQDVPYADVNRSEAEVAIEMAAIGYEYTLEEIAVARRLGINLDTDKAAAALRAYEEFVDGVALYGSVDKGWAGLLNNATVTAGLAPADGAAGATTFPSKTSNQVIRDVNALIGGIYVDTRRIEIADTLLMSLNRFNYLATTPRSDTSDETILSYLLRTNVLTVTTGRPLRVYAVLGLENAGAGGTERMIAYRYARDVVKLHLPMPHRFLTAANVPGSIIFKVPGIFRLGGTEIRRKAAVRYLDGI